MAPLHAATGAAGAASPVRSSGSARSAATPAAAGSAPASPGGGRDAASSGYSPAREWLYRLVTFPHYFTPCRGCTAGCRTPRREQLLTLFDTRSFCVHCSHCVDGRPPAAAADAAAAGRGGGLGPLLQVRRSAFKDVVKASDIGRFGADTGGVQQYTLNSSKVIYLSREQAPERKPGAACTAPAQCSVDGRAMMDKSSLYCSLKCKLIAEDPGFTSWLDGQDPSVRILAHAAANAPPRPTAACKRGGGAAGCGGGFAAAALRAPVPASSTSSDDSGAERLPASSGRPRKLQRLGSDSASASAAPGASGTRRAASACVPLASAPAAPLAPPFGLRPVRTLLDLCGRQRSAPGSLLSAAAGVPELAASPCSPAFGALAACWAEPAEPGGVVTPSLLGGGAGACAADDWWETAAGCAPAAAYEPGACAQAPAAVPASPGCGDEADARLLLVPPVSGSSDAPGGLLPLGCGECLSGAALVACSDSADSAAPDEARWLSTGLTLGLEAAHSAPAAALDAPLLACAW